LMLLCYMESQKDKYYYDSTYLRSLVYPRGLWSHRRSVCL
jgi:hypothetical protein